MKLNSLTTLTSCIGAFALLGGIAFAQERNETAPNESAPNETEQRPPHAHRQPPPEAFEACEELNEGDDCSVEIHDHTIEGTCRNAPQRGAQEDGAADDDAKLVCVPKRHGPPPGHDQEACEGNSANDE